MIRSVSIRFKDLPQASTTHNIVAVGIGTTAVGAIGMSGVGDWMNVIS